MEKSSLGLGLSMIALTVIASYFLAIAIPAVNAIEEAQPQAPANNELTKTPNTSQQHHNGKLPHDVTIGQPPISISPKPTCNSTH